MAEVFHSRYISDYGYEGQIAIIREKEFPNLNGTAMYKLTHLDKMCHGGLPLLFYSKCETILLIKGSD